MFLTDFFEIDKTKLRFGLQVFNDMSTDEVLKFWINALDVSSAQFHKVIVTPARSIETYHHKTKNGVLTVIFCNTKLRNIICRMIENMQ